MSSKAVKFSWDRVDKTAGDDACWPWVGRLNRWGYGVCQYQGKARNASRAAYAKEYGDPGEDLVVCHRCDNPACCNPSHLFAATQAENLADCRRKGRARYATGAAHGRGTAKLNDQLVIKARAMYQSGITQTEIGRQFGVDSSTISRAVRAERWSHVA